MTGDANGGVFYVELMDNRDLSVRSYAIENDFTGKYYFEIPTSEAYDDYYSDDFHNRCGSGVYYFGFDYTKIEKITFGIINVPASTSVSIVIEGVKALAETETTLSDLTMTVDGTTLTVDGNVASGNYLVYDGGGSADVLDPNRSFVETLDVNDTGWQKDANESSVTISSSGATKPWLRVLFKSMDTAFSVDNPFYEASDPSPACGATNVDPNNLVLSWKASPYAADVNGHDVYLGTTYLDIATADHDSNEYLGVYDTNSCTLVSELDANTAYYWAVDEVNDGNVYAGDIWMFTTWDISGQATNPSPADEATSVSRVADLSWTASPSATSHDVYLGTVEADVNDANTSDSEFKGNQAGVTYDPGTLDGSTTYYWRIDEKDGVDTVKGNIWSFTTVDVTESKIEYNNNGGDKMDVKDGQKGSQSWKYGSSGTFTVTKIVLHLSRESEAPNGDLRVDIGTGVNSGAISGSSFDIAQSEITNTSGGSNFMTYTYTYSTPVSGLSQGTTYYLNFDNLGGNGIADYVEYYSGNTYSDGTYYKSGSDDGKDMWFEIWGY